MAASHGGDALPQVLTNSESALTLCPDWQVCALKVQGSERNPAKRAPNANRVWFKYRSLRMNAPGPLQFRANCPKRWQQSLSINGHSGGQHPSSLRILAIEFRQPQSASA